MTQSDHPGPGGWIADRMHHIDASGIRRIFDLAAGWTRRSTSASDNLTFRHPNRFAVPWPMRSKTDTTDTAPHRASLLSARPCSRESTRNTATTTGG